MARKRRTILGLFATAGAAVSLVYALTSGPGPERVDGFILAGVCGLVALASFLAARRP